MIMFVNISCLIPIESMNFYIMRNTITVLSIVFLLCTACERTKYHYIPENERPLLINNDITYFSDSIHSRVDTFKLFVSNFFQSDESSFDESYILRYNVSNSGKSLDFLILQTTGEANLNINKLFFSTHIYSEYKNSYFKEYKLHGITYEDVYVLNDSKLPDSIPNTVYYTFKYGIIRYDYADGRKYELMSETVAKK